jgi:GT2 family glycosyltransferase
MISQLQASQFVRVAPLESRRLARPKANQTVVDGKFLQRNGERFWIKGVTYGSFAPNDQGEPFPPFPQLLDDFACMREAGINTVRIYTPPSDRIADAAADAGLLLVPDICWGPRTCELQYPEAVRVMRNWVRGHCRRLADHPGILMFSIGNEIPPLIVRWHGKGKVEQFLASIAEIVREEAPRSLITYANHPPAEYLNLPFLDVVSFNVYLEREADYRKYLARLQMLAGERPLFLAEIGMDSASNGPEKQAQFLDWQLRATWEKGLCGACVYSWTDEWSIHDHKIEGWSFGLTDADRRPKPALQTAQEIFSSDHYVLRGKAWPRVSVVVASYNGARTLDECLSSLTKLNYPDYEVIVINDGSTDGTREILSRHDVRAIHVPNGGLSRARNLGIAAAEGSIVAFIDSDAYADPDWLYYLTTTLEEHNAVAVGGPNLSPPNDGFWAQCIDSAPGNPMHVLIDNERAEHIPGCNMAFRKDCLETIGHFDPTHRAAGDDVDVCWKLLARGERIAYSPSAIVWHHRRSTPKAFWKQQTGYGAAEAHLERRYPSRFNWFGDLVWAGSIYDGVHSNLRREGLPAVFRPRVYQGQFGSAAFQSIYQPFPIWWFQIFTTAEWQALSVCVLGAAMLSMVSWSPWTIVLGPLLLVLWALTAGAAAIPAIHAAREKRAHGWQWWQTFAAVMGLHLMQPLARGWGRLKGWWAVRKLPGLYCQEQRLYGNLTQRDEWLNRLPKHMASCGWVARLGSEWDDADLEVLGPGPYSLRLFSVYEEDLTHGQHYVRFRVEPRIKGWSIVVAGAIIAVLIAMALNPPLWPLLLPVGGLLWLMYRARGMMTAAVAQLAEEMGAPLGMTKAGF